MEILAGGGEGGDLGAPKIASNCSSADFAIFVFFSGSIFFNAIFSFFLLWNKSSSSKLGQVSREHFGEKLQSGSLTGKLKKDFVQNLAIL